MSDSTNTVDELNEESFSGQTGLSTKAKVALGFLVFFLITILVGVIFGGDGFHKWLRNIEKVIEQFETEGKQAGFGSAQIDQIASLLPYAQYEEAETIMSVSQRGGEQVAVLNNPAIQAKTKKLKLAQVEAELRCF